MKLLPSLLCENAFGLAPAASRGAILMPWILEGVDRSMEIGGTYVGAPLSINLLATQEHHAERYLFDSVPGRGSAIQLVIKSPCHMRRDCKQNPCALARKQDSLDSAESTWPSRLSPFHIVGMVTLFFLLLLGTGLRIHRLQTAPQPPALQASNRRYYRCLTPLTLCLEKKSA